MEGLELQLEAAALCFDRRVTTVQLSFYTHSHLSALLFSDATDLKNQSKKIRHFLNLGVILFLKFNLFCQGPTEDFLGRRE